jgi:signal transduction histidine kinase
VLIADPDPLVRDAVELYFRGHGGIVATVAATAEQVQELLATARYEALVLDATMPAARELSTQAQSTACAVIVTVPLTDTAAAERLPADAAPLLLTKPISMLALDRAIALAVHRIRLERQLAELQQATMQLQEHDRRILELQQRVVTLSQQLEHHQRRFRTAIHDLQNPLANLNALVRELFNRREQLPPLAKENVELCMQSVELMQAIIDDTLSVSQLESQPALQRKPLDVAHLLRSCARRFTAAAEQKNIWINVLTPPSLPPLQADEYHLTKALDNLVSNAIKYTPPGGSVTLEAELTGENIAIYVRDTGVGLSAEDIANAFGEFRRLSSTPTAGEPSTGLGLYIVRRIAELHSGRVQASSPGKGCGSTFTLILPLNPSPGEECPS